VLPLIAAGAALGVAAGWLAARAASWLVERWELDDEEPAVVRTWHRVALAAAGGAAGGTAGGVFGVSAQLVVALAALLWLLLVAAVDLQTRLIPNRLTYPALALAPISAALWPEMALSDHLLGGAVCAGFFGLAFLASPRGIGLGDVKLALVVGLYLGLGRGIVALVATLLLGGVAAVAALVAGLSRKDAIAYGPMLALGAALALVAGDRLWLAYLGHLGAR
jgi:leader peptidase (prepilin peptidase)/N-methyltransferase